MAFSKISVLVRAAAVVGLFASGVLADGSTCEFLAS
jgi:hypothetical protein